MSDKKTESALKRLCALSSQNKEDAEKYTQELKKIAGDIDKKETRTNSDFFKALGDENRLKIIYLLMKRDMCVCEMVAAIETSQPTTSHHLKILENAGLIERKRKGQWVFYGISNPKITEYVKSIPV